MMTATEIELKRRPDVSSLATQAKAHLAMAELPGLVKALGKQQGGIYRTLTEQTHVLNNILKTDVNQRDWTERLHGRMDALAIEGRVTNVLLAELVAVHKSIVQEDIATSSMAIRNDAYDRVMNGE